MTNAGNVVFVVDKLISHLRETSDDAFRASLTERITQLAERRAIPRDHPRSPATPRDLPPSPAISRHLPRARYAPDNSWFIRTMNGVFELGGELVRPDVAHNLMRLIAEGSGEDDEADMALRRFAAATYYSMLDRPILPDILVCVICWVLGEYGYLIGGGVAREPET